jgi:hypothetical protein
LSSESNEFFFSSDVSVVADVVVLIVGSTRGALSDVKSSNDSSSMSKLVSKAGGGGGGGIGIGASGTAIKHSHFKLA